MSSQSSLINAIFIILCHVDVFSVSLDKMRIINKENKSKLNVLLMCECTLLKKKNLLKYYIKHYNVEFSNKTLI